jgi:hypothetical protein
VVRAAKIRIVDKRHGCSGAVVFIVRESPSRTQNLANSQKRTVQNHGEVPCVCADDT